MAGAAHARWSTYLTHCASHSRLGKVPHIRLILHQQPLMTTAPALHWQNPTWITVQIVCRGPHLVIDHRIMLDVESVPGPSLLSLSRVPQEQHPSRGYDPIAVLVLGHGVRVVTAQDRAFKGTSRPNF